MNLKIRYNLWKAKRFLSPTAKFKKDLWSRLENHWQEDRLPNYFWYQTRIFRWSMSAIASLLIVASAATGAYAYTSPDVTEGTPLYSVKKTLESVEEKLSVTPVAKAKFYLKKLDRREAEKKVMEKRRQKLEKVNAEIQNTEKQLEVTDVQLQKTGDNVQLKQKVKDRLNRKLENLDNKLKKVKERLEKREKNLEARKDFLDNVKENFTTSPTENKD